MSIKYELSFTKTTLIIKSMLCSVKYFWSHLFLRRDSDSVAINKQLIYSQEHFIPIFFLYKQIYTFVACTQVTDFMIRNVY